MVWPPQSLLVTLAKMNFCSKAIKMPMDWSEPGDTLKEAGEGAKDESGAKGDAGAKEGAKGGAKGGTGAKEGAKGAPGAKEGAKGGAGTEDGAKGGTAGTTGGGSKA